MGRIESEQLVAPKVLKPLRDEIELTEKALVEMSKKLQKAIEVENKLAKQTKKSAKGFSELAASQKRQKKALTEKEKVDKRILTLQKRSTQITKVQREREQALRVEQTRRNKIAKQQAKITNANIGAFEKLGVKIKILSDRYRDLLVKEGKETKETRRLKKEILSLNKIRNTANENLGNHQNKVGQYTKTISKLRGGLAQLGLAFGVFQLLKGTFNIVKDFDTAMGDLAAITGKSASEIEPLKQQALELGSTTQFTASQVAELQLELAKLGFTTQEIMDSAGGIQKFATATGADIPQAAALAGASLRAFGLDATEMDRVVSVLAVATTKTALDFNFLQSAMSTIAPVANAFGFSIEDTTALLGQLANAGFDASSAATATRNILLNLADANGSLAQELGRPITSADDLAGALIELKDKGVDLATALELTDKRSVAAFETFLNGSDSLVELRDSITGVTGELDEMSAKKLDTISGATDLLKSAWEGLILEWNEGVGAGGMIKDFLLFLAKNLKSIVTIVLSAVKVFVSYKAALTAAATANKIFNTSLNPKRIASFAAGISAAIIAAIELGKELFRIASISDRMNEATERANDLIAEETAKMDLLRIEIFSTNAASEERQAILDRINAKYGTTLKNLQDETQFVNQLAAAYKDVVAQLKNKITAQVIEEELLQATKDLREVQRKIENTGAIGLLNPVGTALLFEEEDALIKLIADLEDEFARLKTEGVTVPVNLETNTDVTGGGTTGGGGGTIDAEQKKAEKLAAFRKQQELDRLQFESSMLEAGVDRDIIEQELAEQRIKQFRFEQEFIISLNFKTTEELKKTQNAYLKFIEANQIERIELNRNANEQIFDDDVSLMRLRMENHQKHLDIMAKREAELWKKVRQDIADTGRLIAEVGKNRIAQLDLEASKEQQIFNDSKSREEELKQLAAEKGLDASESIKAEREAQKASLEAQRKIAEEKAKTTALLALVTAWASRVQSGQGNPVENVKTDFNNLKSFVEGAFYSGTEHTLADALHRTGTKDGHIIRADDNEAIFTGQQTSDLGIKKGGNSTQDIVDMYKGGILGASVRESMDSAKLIKPVIRTESISNKKLDQIINNTNPANQLSDKTVFNALTGHLEFQRRQGGKIKYRVRK